MDITEFIKREKPSGRRLSRIAPFLAQVIQLKADGYSDDQVRAFLAANGVRVTQPTVSRFVSKHRHLIQKTLISPTETPVLKSPIEKPILSTPVNDIDKRDVGNYLSAKQPERKSVSSILSEIESSDSPK